MILKVLYSNNVKILLTTILSAMVKETINKKFVLKI